MAKESGGLTAADLSAHSEQELKREDIAPFVVPDSQLPLQPLSKSDLLDYKIWNLTIQGSAFNSRFSNNYGYYTTKDSYLRTPINNRFLHGMLAYKTEAKFVYAYAAAAWWNDPSRDFDLRPNWPLFTGIEPDRIFVYPTASGELIPAMNAEGLREGIKDAKYIATLKELIAKEEAKMLHLNGTLIKADNAPEIYLLEDSKKRHIPSWSVFASQFNLRAVVIIISSEVNSYPLGDPLPYQEGTLFRVKDSPAVYVVENGKKRHLPTPEIFESMGYNWGAVIMAEDNNLADLHPTGEPISPIAAHPDGTLVKTASLPEVYLLEKGKKRHIPAPSIFSSRFIFWDRIVFVSPSELDSYSLAADVPYRDGTLFQVMGEPAVYAVASGQKRTISSAAVFARLGSKCENIILVENSSISELLPTGADLN